MSNGALFPNHVIMPEAIWREKEWKAQQAENHIERIQKVAADVFGYDWSDCDEDARVALERLRSAING